MELIYGVLIINNPIYIGFSMEFSIYRYILATAIIIGTTYFLPLNRKLSSCFVYFYYLVAVIPLLSLYALESNSTFYIILSMVCFYIILLIIRMNIKLEVKSFKISPKIFDITCYILILGLVLSLYAMGYRPNILALNLDLNYLIRENVEFNGFIGYYFGLISRAIIPGCFILSVFEKKYLKSFTFIILQLLVFMFFPQKTILFSLLVVLVIYFIVGIGKYYKYLVSFQIGYFLLAFLLYVVFNFQYLITFMPRRTHFTPADIQFSYYDFFLDGQFLNFSQNMIGRILHINEVYDVSIVYIIGGLYYNSPNMSANTNFLADGFANFGFIGMLIVTIILTIALIILDNFTKEQKLAVNLSICFMPLYALVDASLFTTFLTHGLLWVIIFIFFTHFRTRDNH